MWHNMLYQCQNLLVLVDKQEWDVVTGGFPLIHAVFMQYSCSIYESNDFLTQTTENDLGVFLLSLVSISVFVFQPPLSWISPVVMPAGLCGHWPMPPLPVIKLRPVYALSKSRLIHSTLSSWILIRWDRKICWLTQGTRRHPRTTHLFAEHVF